MNIKHYNHPVLFYSLATAIPWLFWFTTAYLSHLEAGTPAYASVENLLGAVGLSIPVIIASFMIIGLAAPMITAFAMMFSNDHLKNDLFHRVFRLTAVDPVYIFLACFLMLASILLASVSLPCPVAFPFRPVFCRHGSFFFWRRCWKNWPGILTGQTLCADGSVCSRHL